jgi:hypothetical protein
VGVSVPAVSATAARLAVRATLIAFLIIVILPSFSRGRNYRGLNYTRGRSIGWDRHLFSTAGDFKRFDVMCRQGRLCPSSFRSCILVSIETALSTLAVTATT